MKTVNTVKSTIWFLLVPFPLTYVVPWLINLTNVGKFTIGITWLGFSVIILGTTGLFYCFFEFVYSGKGTPVPFEPPKRLLSSKLYRYTRNPMYLAVISIIIGESIWYENWIIVIYGVLLWAVLHLWIVLYEEPALNKKFGKKYEDYVSKTQRWL